MFHSNRPPTKLSAPTHTLEIRTVSDFLTLITHYEVPRAVRNTSTTYCSNIIGAGSQFTVYDHEGIDVDRAPPAVKTINFGGPADRVCSPYIIKSTD